MDWQPTIDIDGSILLFIPFEHQVFNHINQSNSNLDWIFPNNKKTISKQLDNNN